MAGRDGNSEYYEVQGSGKSAYKITINYDTGHWCTCRGMISKKGTYNGDAGKTQGTSCKHIKQIINTHYDGDWGTKNRDGSRTPSKPAVSPGPAPSKPTGRRAAVMATRAKLASKTETTETASSVAGGSLLDRIASLEEAREGASS